MPPCSLARVKCRRCMFVCAHFDVCLAYCSWLQNSILTFPAIAHARAASVCAWRSSEGAWNTCLQSMRGHLREALAVQTDLSTGVVELEGKIRELQMQLQAAQAADDKRQQEFVGAVGRMKSECTAALEMNATLRSHLAGAAAEKLWQGGKDAMAQDRRAAGGTVAEVEFHSIVARMKRECLAALEANNTLQPLLVAALAPVRGLPGASADGAVPLGRQSQAVQGCVREMPTLRCRPSTVKDGEDGYESFRRAVRAKFDRLDKGSKGVLNESDAVQLVVHLFSSTSSCAQHLSAKEYNELAAKVIRRHGKKEQGTMDFEEFLSWYSEVNGKLRDAADAWASVDPNNLPVWMCLSARVQTAETGYFAAGENVVGELARRRVPVARRLLHAAPTR